LIGSTEVFGDPESAERLVGELPNAELEILPGAGYWPWLDGLEHAAGVIPRFLDVDGHSLRSA
jgi:pimeloyl-ACP methyl ester carboxylesterase